MTQYLIRRLIGAVFVIWIVTTFVFFALRVLPGDFAAQQVANQFLSGATARGQSDVATTEAQGQATERESNQSNSANVERSLQAARERLGIDKSIPHQYGLYWKNFFTGDHGTSFRTSRPAVTETLEALPYTLQLGLMSIIIALLLAVPVGILSAMRPNTFMDGSLRVFAIFFLAAPSFWTAALLSGWAVKFDILEINIVKSPGIWQDPWESFQLFIVPALAGGLATGAILMRFIRSGLLEVLRQDYVRTAHAKGLRERAVMARHVLRNALIPVVTIIGFIIAALVAGNIILETMFNIRGMGQQLFRAILMRDVHVAQFMTLLFVGAVVFVNLAVDLSYFLIDPRVTVSSVEQ